MSKLLKRTLTFALIFCMLLSVLPAASAEETDEPAVYTYDFTLKSGGATTATSGGTPTATESTYVNNYPESDYISGKNSWYYLMDGQKWGWGQNYAAVSSNGISYASDNVSKGLAIGGVKVEKDGFYDITLAFMPTLGKDDMRFGLIKLNDTIKTGLANAYKYGTTSSSWSCWSTYFADTVSELAVDVNVKISGGRRGGVTSYAILGTHELTEGEYAIIMTGKSTYSVKTLTLTESGTGKAVNDAFYASGSNTNDLGWTTVLCDDVVWPDADIIGYGQACLDLNGHNMTVNSVTNAAIADLSANGTGKLIANKVAFRYDNSTYTGVSNDARKGQIGVYNATEGAYMFYDYPGVATTSNTSYTNPLYNAEDNTVQFAAKFIIEDDVRQAIAAGGSGFQMQMYWQVGDEAAVTAVLDDATAAKWAADSSTDVLQITLQGLEGLEAGTVIKCTPRVVVNNTFVTGTTLTFTVPEA